MLHAAAAAPASRRTISANWGRFMLSQETLEEYQQSGLISSNTKWSAGGEEVEPTPTVGEVVVFGQHLFRIFSPPGNLFFRQLLAHYNLRIHDLSPNYALNLSNFVTLCEDYLQIKPDLDLWLRPLAVLFFNVEPLLCKEVKVLLSPSLFFLAMSRTGKNLISIAKTHPLRTSLACPTSPLTAWR